MFDDIELVNKYFYFRNKLYEEVGIYTHHPLYLQTDSYWINGGNVIYYGDNKDEMDLEGPYAYDISQFITTENYVFARCDDDGMGGDPFYFVLDKSKEIK